VAYTVRLDRLAQKALDALRRDPLYPAIQAAIQALATTPRPTGCIKLTNSVRWRIRVQTYRVIYEIDDPAQTVQIRGITDRKDVYRRK